jgi:hypothetical protein
MIAAANLYLAGLRRVPLPLRRGPLDALDPARIEWLRDVVSA